MRRAELTLWKRSWCWERLKAGGEGDDRGWDDWMASPTQWTWAWENLRRLWWTGKTGVLQSTGSQVVRHNWTAEQVIHDRPNLSALWDLSFNGYTIKLKFCKYKKKCAVENKIEWLSCLASWWIAVMLELTLMILGSKWSGWPINEYFK